MELSPSAWQCLALCIELQRTARIRLKNSVAALKSVWNPQRERGQRRCDSAAVVTTSALRANVPEAAAQVGEQPSAMMSRWCHNLRRSLKANLGAQRLKGWDIPPGLASTEDAVELYYGNFRIQCFWNLSHSLLCLIISFFNVSLTKVQYYIAGAPVRLGPNRFG